MKQKISRFQAALEIMPLIDYYVAGSIQLFKENIEGVSLYELSYKELCYALYFDCVRYSLVYFQKLSNENANEIINRIEDNVIETVFQDDEKSRKFIDVWQANLVKEVVDVFDHVNTPFKELIEQFEEYVVKDYTSVNRLNEAKLFIGEMFQTFGREIISRIRKDYKIDRK